MDVSKAREFRSRFHPHVKVCATCSGQGSIHIENKYGEYNLVECEDCGGSGRIVESRETIVRTRPFRPGIDDDGSVLSM